MSGRAAVYARVSTDEQAREGYSLAGQQRLCLERAAADGHIVDEAHVYIDPGMSGTRADRPEYVRMLAVAANGAFQAVYVWKLDRLGRDAEELLRVRRMLGGAGVRLISITEGTDESTLVYGVRALVAQEERDKISERTRAGLREVAAEGRSPTGQPPLGYRLIPGVRRGRGWEVKPRWEIDPPHDETVRRIHALKLAGVGVNRIATTLNEEGYRTRRGARFGPRVILDVLGHPAYVGLVRHGGEVFGDPARPFHEPILDLETWWAVRQLREAHKAMPSGGRGRRPKRHLLAPLLYDRYGHQMIPRRNPNGWEYYRCCRRHTYGDCPTPAISRARVDLAFGRYFDALVYDPVGTRASLVEAAEFRVAEARALAADADRQVAKIAVALDGAYRSLMDGRIAAETYESLVARGDPERETAEAEAERLREQAEALEQEARALDAHAELADRLAEIKAAVAGEIESAERIVSLRITLERTFERIIITTLDDEPLPDPGGAVLLGGVPPIADEKAGLWLVPIPRPDAFDWRRDLDSGPPAYRRAAIRLQERDGDSSDFAPWPPGKPCREARRSRRPARRAEGVLPPPRAWLRGRQARA